MMNSPPAPSRDARSPATSLSSPEPRVFGEALLRGANWQGLWTLYLKEVRRFFKVQLQTIWAPAVTTLLFLAVFLLALGQTKRVVLGMPFADFLAPGLIMMAIAQAAFANSSSSLVIGKIQGTIVDLLMAPLTPRELLASLVAAAVTRALLVGAAVWAAIALWPGVDAGVARPGLAFAFALSGAALMALIGVLTGLWADKFDHAAAVTNFVVQPLTLLSGTFYAVSTLGPGFQTASAVNPFYYMIDGFRHGMTGVGETPLGLGLGLVFGLCLVLWALSEALMRAGWKLRS